VERNWAGVLVGLAIACTVTACEGSKPGVTQTNAIDLIKAGDAKACAHPEILKTLNALLANPKGDEQTVLPLTPDAIAKLDLPQVTIDRISLASVDSSVHRLSCKAMSNITADIGGPSQRFEREITYSLTPSASNDQEFIVSTDASVAADRINIAIVKSAATGIQKVQADAATEARLQAALQNAGAVGSVTPAPAVQPTKSASPQSAIEAQYSTDYKRCMDSGDAANGVTSAMVDCTSTELAKQDGRLNRAFGAAMAKRDVPQKEALRNEQRAWIKRRDTKCKEDLEGGTMDQIVEMDCHLSMTTGRATELESVGR
jgi:uncharacterized protein YecT (DUF1311 family)